MSKHKHTATFTFSDAGATSFQCSLVKLKKRKEHGHHAKANAPPRYSSCGSPAIYKHLKHGKYEFFVRGLNASGTGGAATARLKV